MRRSTACALGLALGGVMVGVVLHGRGVPAWLWGLLVVYILAWPHAARLLLRGRADPIAVDARLFLGNAAMAGSWAAFGALPYHLRWFSEHNDWPAPERRT